MNPSRPGRLTLDRYEQGLLAGDRGTLARAITLVESRLPEDARLAAELLQRVKGKTGGALRVGITGPPGAGKSTLIDELGCRLLDAGRTVAVLAIDPSSQLSGGSILGDKTRMERLSQREEAFIRPSPAAGSLGGVARRTRESLQFCEAAGFDTILVETVGVGQSEVQVRQLCDVFLLLLQAGAGDDLQGIKRGIMELADVFAVGKADGPLKDAATKAQADVASAAHLLPPLRPGWTPPVLAVSALSGDGLDELWTAIAGCGEHLAASGQLAELRRGQELAWFRQQAEEAVLEGFYRHPAVAERLAVLRAAVAAGELSAELAAFRLLEGWRDGSA